MTQQKQLSKDDILNLAKEFAISTLAINTSEVIDPTNMCLRMCYPLYLHLKNNGVENLSIRNGECEGRPHYWINLEDEAQTIIDPTIRQFDFGKQMPHVYRGEKLCYYQENINFRFAELNYPLALLQNFFVDYNNKCYPDFADKLDERINLDCERKILLRAGIIINSEMEEMEKSEKDFHTSKLHLDFFQLLKELLSKYTDETQLKEFSNLKGFNNLRSRIDIFQ